MPHLFMLQFSMKLLIKTVLPGSNVGEPHSSQKRSDVVEKHKNSVELFKFVTKAPKLAYGLYFTIQTELAIEHF